MQPRDRKARQQPIRALPSKQDTQLDRRLTHRHPLPSFPAPAAAGQSRLLFDHPSAHCGH